MPISTLILSAWGSLKRYRLIGSIEVQGSITDLMEPSSEMVAVEVPRMKEHVINHGKFEDKACSDVDLFGSEHVSRDGVDVYDARCNRGNNGRGAGWGAD